MIEILGPPNELYYKQSQNTQCCDYFYNYFSEGFDLMFDGNTNNLKKAILYTNMPDYCLFNEYDRCNFIINLPNQELNPLSKWEDIVTLFQEPLRDEGNRRNPHGYDPSRYFSYKGMLFEVLSSGYIGSVTLSC